MDRYQRRIRMEDSMPRSTVTMTTLSLLLIATACATTGENRRSSDSSVITAEEVAASPTSNAYDLVQSLRPRWLSIRSPNRGGSAPQQSAILVYLDGTRLGPLGTLRSVNNRDVHSVRRLNASDATQRFGTGHTHGAILVRTR